MGLAKAAPEGGVEENDVDRLEPDAGGELLEIDHHGVGRGRDVDRAPQPPHALEPPARVLEVVVVEVLDRLADPDPLLDAPHAVGVEADAVLGEGRAEGAEDFDVVAWAAGK